MDFVNREILPLSRIQREGESLFEEPLLWGSERDLGRVDSERDLRLSMDLGKDPKLSPWTYNGPASMSSLLFA